MTPLAESMFAAVVELPKAEARCRRYLRKRDCRLVCQGTVYFAVSRTTGSAEAGPLDIDTMEMWARGGDR